MLIKTRLKEFSTLEIIFCVFVAGNQFREGAYPSILKSSDLFGLGFLQRHHILTDLNNK